MSIIIRKKDTGEIFDVLPSFVLEIKNTSPIFNELGSKTVTTSLPKTDNNIRLLGFAHRIDISYKPSIKLSVQVSAGSYIREGILYLSSAYNTDNTFGITIAFNEGIMYESMSDILLTELSNLPLIESSVDELLEMMNTYFTTDGADDPLSVFYVQFKTETYKEEDKEEDKEWSEYVNGVQMQDDNTARLAVRDMTVVIEENKTIETSVPYGYGITPFVRVWYLLELVFDHYGYKVGKNTFRDDYQLKRLCVLNNTADAIVSGKLDYKQLLPPVTITELLDALYCRFGLKIMYNSNTNTIDLLLIRDIFKSTAMQRLSLSSFIDIDYTAAKQLKLTVAKNLDESQTETETYEEFLTKYDYTIGTIETYADSVAVGGVYFDARAGQFIQCSTINQEKKRLSSVHFDWNKKDENIEVEEISSSDEALTMKHAANESFVFLYYGLNCQLKNSFLTVNGSDRKVDTQNVLAFAYDMGEASLDLGNGISQKLGHKYGSIFPYAYQSNSVLQKDATGNEFNYALTLIGKHGAFNQFFKDYDAFLRHSNHTVKVKSYQLEGNLSNVDFATKINIENQLLLLDKLDHNLDGSIGQDCNIEARTLRLCEPFDLDNEQLLPTFEDIKYKWTMYSDQSLRIKQKREEIEKSLPEELAGHIANVTLTAGEILEDANPPGDSTYWFLPPSEYQYINNYETGSRTHTCKVSYTCKYLYNRGTTLNPDWETITQRYIEDIKYKSWFEAELV